MVAHLSPPSFTFRFACFALTFLVLPMAVRAQAPPSTEELIAEIDKAFDVPPPPMKPPFVFFPLVDGDGRVNSDIGLSYLAAYAAAYTDSRRIDICLPWMRDVLHDAGCLKLGGKIDEETIRLCLAALGAKLYAVPKLALKGDAYLLTIECHGDGVQFRERSFTHTIRPRNRCQVPGLIAQSVLEYLGVRLTDHDRERIMASQPRDERDLRTLLDTLERRAAAGIKASEILALVDRNPRCPLAWEQALMYHDTRVEALRRFNQLQPRLECPRPHLNAAAQVRELGEPIRAIRMLLPYAASHHDDSYFNTTLMKCAMRLQDEKLTRHILELWRKNEPGYSGCLRRGILLIDWAWDARGSGWANQVTPEAGRLFEERLREAERELKKALRLNPSGWDAHGRLITVARGLGWPSEVMQEHFRRAIKLRPRYAHAYEMKFRYLQPRWHGEPEELFQFGRECVATGYWDELIPRLMFNALEDLSTNPRDGGKICQVLRAPAVWDAALEYYKSAQKGADLFNRQRVLNEVVRWGIYGEHFDDVVVLCQRLRGRSRIHDAVWPDSAELEYLYDLVHAKTGRLKTQLLSSRRNDLGLAKTAAALAEGDPELAAKEIEKIEPGDHIDIDTVASYRAAIDVGRRLARDKKLDLKGAEGLRAFVGCRPLWQHSGDRFVCTLGPNSRVTLLFPLGLRHGMVRGTVDWSDGVSYAQIVTHTRALRDQVILRYLPNNTVQLIRNKMMLEQAPRPAGRLDFRFVYDKEWDVFQPASGIAWRTGVYDYVPSGFAFQIFTTDRGATVSISGLHLEQMD